MFRIQESDVTNFNRNAKCSSAIFLFEFAIVTLNCVSVTSTCDNATIKLVSALTLRFGVTRKVGTNIYDNRESTCFVNFTIVYAQATLVWPLLNNRSVVMIK